MSEGISVASDARHGWRKNAKDTSVVVMGDSSHKVLHHQHVTKGDEPVSQRHEVYGTRRSMEALDEQGVVVGVWTHDRNSAVNKLINETPW